MKTPLHVVLTGLLVLFALPMFSQTQWDVVDEKNEIKMEAVVTQCGSMTYLLLQFKNESDMDIQFTYEVTSNVTPQYNLTNIVSLGYGEQVDNTCELSASGAIQHYIILDDSNLKLSDFTMTINL